MRRPDKTVFVIVLVAAAIGVLFASRYLAEWALSAPITVIHDDEIIQPCFQERAAFAWWNNTSKYPPLGFFFLSFFRDEGRFLPYERAVFLHLAFAWAGAVLVLLSVYRLSRSLLAAAVTGLVYATTPGVLFYAGTLHAETPYVFWITCSAALAIHAGRSRGRLWPCALTVLAFGAAVLSKDQAYPLVLPLGIWVGIRIRRYGLREAIGAASGAMASAMLALIAYGWAATGLPDKTVWGAMQAHLDWITHQGIEQWRQHSSLPSGWPGLLGDAFRTLYEFYHPAMFAATTLLVLLSAAGLLRSSSRDGIHGVESGDSNPADGPAACATLGALTLLGVVCYFALFLVPIGYVFHRFWMPLWPLLIITAGAAAARLLEGRRLLITAAIIGVALLCWYEGSLTLGYITGDARLRVSEAARSLKLIPACPSAAHPSVIPVVSREFGFRYQFLDGRWAEVPAIRNWSAGRYGVSVTPTLKLGGLLPHPFEFYLYQPDFVVAWQEYLPLHTAAAWGYEKRLVLENDRRHPALPIQPVITVYVAKEGLKERLLDACRADPLSRDRAWLIGSSLSRHLLSKEDRETGEGISKRFFLLWQVGARGDPAASPPRSLAPGGVRLVRTMLERGRLAFDREKALDERSRSPKTPPIRRQ